jgi:hypothetical protein
MGSPVRVKKICEPFAMGGNKVITFNYFSGPVSYTTGGDQITAKDLGLTWIHQAFIAIADSADRILYPVPVNADGDVMTAFKALITDLAGTQVANASNQSTKKFRIVAIGTY